MCIIIAKPAGKKISTEVLERCLRIHPDGFGISFEDGGKLFTAKGLFEIKAISTLVEFAEPKDAVIHFRAASPGMLVNEDNCHPFCFQDREENPRFQFSVFHNGRLDWRSDDKMSDTHCFVEDVVRPHFSRDPFFIECDYGVPMLSRVISTSSKPMNKMVIARMTMKTGKLEIFIINKAMGAVLDDVWYSNDSHLPPPTPVSYTHGYHRGIHARHRHEYEDEYWEHVDPSFAAATRPPDLVPIPRLTEAEVEALRIKDGFTDLYCKPDSRGWFWSIKNHWWQNIETGYATMTITTLKAPYHIILGTGESQNDRLVAHNKAVGVAKTKTDEEAKKKKEETRKEGIKARFPHLNTSDIQTMAKEAEFVFHEILGFEPSTGGVKMKIDEKINWVRDTVRDLVENCKNMEDGLLDLWIIEGVKDGSFRKELLQKIEERERSEEQAEALRVAEKDAAKG